MRLTCEARLEVPFGTVRQALLSPATLEQIAAPLIRFIWSDPPERPTHWQPRRHKVLMRLFGVVPLGWQVIDPVIDQDQPDHFILVDRGSGPLISVWHHRLILTRSEGGCHYADGLTLAAGMATPLVWLFAWVFFHHRQRRLRALLQSPSG
ncbi:MAG: hypothetical protein ACFB22_08705 [Rhodothalassiaceae bacterium]